MKLRDIPGYKGDYKADEEGNIWSFKMKKPKVLSPWEGGTSPYLMVHLSTNGTSQKKLVHRLVAEAFLERAEEYNIVHHIDGNPQNNKVENLEWTTQQANIHHSYKTLGKVRNFIPVELYHRGHCIGRFNSKTEASRRASDLGASYSSLMRNSKTGEFELRKCND